MLVELLKRLRSYKDQSCHVLSKSNQQYLGALCFSHHFFSLGGMFSKLGTELKCKPLTEPVTLRSRPKEENPLC